MDLDEQKRYNFTRKVNDFAFIVTIRGHVCDKGLRIKGVNSLEG
jgi:hypothetical protein